MGASGKRPWPDTTVVDQEPISPPMMHDWVRPKGVMLSSAWTKPRL